MNHVGTITRLIRDLEGDEISRRDNAVRELWECFFADLVAHARKRLRSVRISKGPADEEDAASLAFAKVCRGIASGQLRLVNRVDLTKVLRSATTREVFRLLGRAKLSAESSSVADALQEVPDSTLPPDLLLLAFDACQRLLDLLATDELRQIAIWKLAGYTNDAIAHKLECSPSTVERTLSRIRETWRQSWGDVVPRGPSRSGPRRGVSTSVDRANAQREGCDTIESGGAAQLLRELAGLE
jgi:DNA-directed RNA polymerase specialized sigma24 family protein